MRRKREKEMRAKRYLPRGCVLEAGMTPTITEGFSIKAEGVRSGRKSPKDPPYVGAKSEKRREIPIQSK